MRANRARPSDPAFRVIRQLLFSVSLSPYHLTNRQITLPTGRGPKDSASFPDGITITPERPRAASTAASGFEATAMFASSPRSAAQRKRFWSNFWQLLAEKQFHAGQVKNRRVGCGIFHARREAIARNPARPRVPPLPAAGWNAGAASTPGQSSAWVFVMPGVMPMQLALSFTAKSFSSGGLPSKIATACARNSGPARNTAATGKFGTKMQAKGMATLESLSD